MAGLKRMRLVMAGLFFLTIVVTIGAPALAEGKGEDSDWPQRAGLWAVYGAAQDKPDEYDFFSLNPSWGIFLNDPGPGYKSSFEFAVEGFFNYHTGDFSGDFEVGVRPILRWHYGYLERFSPFIEVSTAGVLYTNLDIPETGSDLNFSSHAGLGVNIRISPKTHLSLAYRFRHVSNAGLSEDNSGLNHHEGLLGLFYYFE